MEREAEDERERETEKARERERIREREKGRKLERENWKGVRIICSLTRRLREMYPLRREKERANTQNDGKIRIKLEK